MFQIHPCSSCLPPTPMPIMAVARTQNAPPVLILWRFPLELFPGSQSNNPLLHCQQPKLNTWLHAKLARRLSGCARCCSNSVFPCPHRLSCTWTTNLAIQVAKHPEHHGRMKQLNLSWFWLQDVVDQGTILPTYVPTGEMTADLLTKALPCLKMEYFCKQMELATFRGS